MEKERLEQIGKFLNDRMVIHREVENNSRWTTEEKMIQELYDSYLNLLIEYNKQKEIIDKAIYLTNDPWSFESGNKEVDEIDHQMKTKLLKILRGVKMEDVIQSLEPNYYNGDYKCCFISEEKLNDLKELFKNLRQENIQLKEQIKDIDMWNKLYNEEFNKNNLFEYKWKKLKEYIEKAYYNGERKDIKEIINKMQELEKEV